MRLPDRQAPATVDHPVSLVALAPTILDLLGLSAGDAVFQAESIAPLMLGMDVTGPDVVFFEVEFGFDEEAVYKKSIVAGGLKLIHDIPTGDLELYDLSRDLREANSLADRHPERVAELVPVLDACIESARAISNEPEETTFNEGELERLRSLGYVQ